MTFPSKQRLKKALGGLPFTAEVDWFLRRRGQPVEGLILEHLRAALPNWADQAAASSLKDQPGKKVFIFST